ncbi:KilA-N domain-containing protein [Xenococcus sp. PCC 7305]|uniref:KilA-N domain-containing protein n=1 Tax=Xenococcus sp. PCC 7305 TaxID=102125 RepID=UPI0002ABAB38|nr:KilA-N domain-containing protein [Xenococcus sp. PCC 7305]ELS01160.1 KilA-N domain-containing protein [Xenococcus sp. PCC 7305]
MNFINFDYQGKLIQKREDSYINLTQMCVANNKKLNDFLRLKSTKAYLDSLSVATGIPVAQIIEVINGAQTWGHKLISIRLAQWISSDFSVWCDAHIFNLIETGSTSIDIDPIDKMIELEKLKKETAKYTKESKELDQAMLVMHGKETVLALRGCVDQVVEVEKPTIEVIDERHNLKYAGQTLKQIASYLNKTRGYSLKSGGHVERILEEAGEQGLIGTIPRTAPAKYVPEENLPEAVNAVIAIVESKRQLLLGES